ncbi:hypothetical protein E4K72_21625 [Oxalobacteraceae bacterium OM1]|nr:hypothetical protein E4K72_21625 [Oxalobacteraceae bacterium OM1]
MSIATDLATFHRALLQGDVRTALQAYDGTSTDDLPDKDVAAATCIRERFAAPLDRQSGTLGPMVNAYRQYWRALMLNSVSTEAAEAELFKRLTAALPSGPWQTEDAPGVTRAVRAELEARGYHAVTGVTKPYYELIVWEQERPADYVVRLPTEDLTVHVVFMDRFISGGWLDYASCGRFGVGGWAANDVLYAAAPRYDTDTEQFRVNYLAHEGQHAADLRRYPGLDQAELEYRAKLVEIIYASKPYELLARFATTAQPGRAVPHAHAQYWLARRLGNAAREPRDRDAIRAAARALLTESADNARSATESGTNRFLPD